MLDSYANFNVTGSMTFCDIIFKGENALAVAADPDVTLTHPPLATLPVLKCSVSTEPTGTHTAIDFDENADVAADLAGLFTCTDSSFTAAEVPLEDLEACDIESTETESVRSCGGDPYHEDFFVFDSVTALPYKRHRVLFNVYAWDRVRSYKPDTRAELILKDCSFWYFLADYESLINIETNNMAVI